MLYGKYVLQRIADDKAERGFVYRLLNNISGKHEDFKNCIVVIQEHKNTFEIVDEKTLECKQACDFKCVYYPSNLKDIREWALEDSKTYLGDFSQTVNSEG
jgi:hypothetical protein